MKSYEQRTENITKKARSISARRKAWISVAACACCVAIVCGVLFAPIFHDNPPNINIYRKSEYFPLIEKISVFNEKYYIGDSSIWNEIDTSMPGGATAPGDVVTSPSEPSNPTNKYEETTMNQVAGVTEGDILKRSTNHAFYLKSVWENVGGGRSVVVHKIFAYAIGKEQRLVGEYSLRSADDTIFTLNGWASKNPSTEMYLSEDANTLTVLADCKNESGIAYTCVVSLDVSNPENISEKARTYVAGKYLSSRKVKGELLLMTNFFVPHKPDYDNPECFIPSCGAMDNRDYFKMDEIYCPDYVSACSYTVVAKMNESNLDVTSKQAVLSYSFDMAVSTKYIFVVRNRHEYKQNGQIVEGYFNADADKGPVQCRAFCEIVCLKYEGELENIGCVQLDGTVKDRYSLDEKDGILRVVTDTDSYTYISENDYVKLSNRIRSVSLHCVDVEEMKVVGGVDNFAPQDERARAVRYDEDKAYVCTSVQNTDPVFVFDLSDISHITYKDTGTIPGYSINLMKFGDNLLGIGYGEDRNILKIELFSEQESNVASVAQYQKDLCTFSERYKAHFVDAERQLVGLQIVDYSQPQAVSYYLLLQFDGNQFNVLLNQRVAGSEELTRAFYNDGFYLFTSADVGAVFFFDEESLFKQSNG